MLSFRKDGRESVVRIPKATAETVRCSISEVSWVWDDGLKSIPLTQASDPDHHPICPNGVSQAEPPGPGLAQLGSSATGQFFWLKCR